jgi:hypothetical protein
MLCKGLIATKPCTAKKSEIGCCTGHRLQVQAPEHLMPYPRVMISVGRLNRYNDVIEYKQPKHENNEQRHCGLEQLYRYTAYGSTLFMHLALRTLHTTIS